MKILRILQNGLYGSGATPLPLGICLVVYLLILFNGMMTTNLSSYLPQLVKEYNVTEENAGKYAGIVSSSMSISRIFSSIMWGYLCDKYGKKKSLLVAGSTLAATTLMFGFSYNYLWAVFSRSLQGLCMGLIVITKAIVSDVADNTNLAVGLSLIFSANNIGYVIGPSMAGFLVFPTQKYPTVFTKGGFFDTFKVLLPNLIIAFGIFLSLIIALVLLPQNDQKKNLKEEMDVVSENQSTELSSLKEDLHTNDELALINEEKDVQQKSNVFCCHCLSQKSKYYRLFTNKSFLLSIILYGLYSMTTVGYEDLFPVFASTSVQYNGLGMTTSDIGLLYLVTGFTMIVIQFLVINKLVNKFGAKRMFCITTLLFSALVFLLPTDGMIKNRKSLWVALWITQCLMRTMYSSGILCVNMFINNSVESDLLGVANGLGLSMASVGRSIGSLVFGMFYTWSMSNVKNSKAENKSATFPFNEYFAFTLIALSAIIVVIVTTHLPKSINSKKV